MNRRTLLVTTARTVFLVALGAVTGARAQTPIDSRTDLPIPQTKTAASVALDAVVPPAAHRHRASTTWRVKARG